ncbi:MAG: transposase [Candidatus Niyogibacteria bacterium]|nr:transposase [Candidatus Niyogibacteria bacterium]
MRKESFAENEIYHIYNRGVEKRNIFSNEKDYYRFIHNLFEFNDEAPALDAHCKPHIKSYEAEPHTSRKQLVDILIFTLMPNHFHLLVRAKDESGVPRFMHKLGTGYVMYFNQKYKRVGPLFQGKFKAIRIDRESHLMHIPHYIHMNPLDLQNVRVRGSASLSVRMQFLENYRWSSFPDYMGKKNFPSITTRDFLLDYFDGKQNYKQKTKEWIRDWKTNTEEMDEVALDNNV